MLYICIDYCIQVNIIVSCECSGCWAHGKCVHVGVWMCVCTRVCVCVVFHGADGCIPLIIFVDVCQCCCLLMFVCLPLSRHFPCCKTWWIEIWTWMCVIIIIYCAKHRTLAAARKSQDIRRQVPHPVSLTITHETQFQSIINGVFWNRNPWS